MVPGLDAFVGRSPDKSTCFSFGFNFTYFSTCLYLCSVKDKTQDKELLLPGLIVFNELLIPFHKFFVFVLSINRFFFL